MVEIEAEIAEITTSFKMLSFRVRRLFGGALRWRATLPCSRDHSVLCPWLRVVRVCVCASQIDQSKDQLSTKDGLLVKIHFEHHQVQKEIDSLRSELSRTKRNVHAAQLISQAQEGEVKKLLSVLEAADSEKDKQVKECQAVIGERDLLLAQFTQRESELTQLYEKIKVQASSIDTGKAVYGARKAEEMQLLQQIAQLKQELYQSNVQVCACPFPRGLRAGPCCAPFVISSTRRRRPHSCWQLPLFLLHRVCQLCADSCACHTPGVISGCHALAADLQCERPEEAHSDVATGAAAGAAEDRSADEGEVAIPATPTTVTFRESSVVGWSSLTLCRHHSTTDTAMTLCRQFGQPRSCACVLTSPCLLL